MTAIPRAEQFFGQIGGGSVRPGKTFSQDTFVNLYVVSEMIALATIVFGCSLVAKASALSWSYATISILLATVYGSLVATNGRQGYVSRELAPLQHRLKSWIFTCIAFVCLGFLFKVSDQFSRIWAVSSVLAGMVAILAGNIVGRHWLDKLIADRKICHRTVIYGGTDRTRSLLNILSREMPLLDVIGIVDSRGTRFADESVNSLRGMALNDLVEHIGDADVETVLIDLPWSAETRIRQIKRAFEAVNVDVLLAPYHADLYDDTYDLVQLGNLKGLSLYTRPVRGLSSLAKRVFDRVAAAILLVICAPLFLVTALAIRFESPGPVFFKQPRQGFNNKPFMMYKFRSMYADMTDVRGTQSASRSDARITFVGSLIRKTSIDELPQIMNVLRGEMSLVGPRPHAYGSLAGDKTFIEAVDRYAARHRVLPGMTGLAQVRGHRGATETEQHIRDRVDSDLEYIRRWSLALDLEILLRTFYIVLNPKNAF